MANLKSHKLIYVYIAEIIRPVIWWQTWRVVNSAYLFSMLFSLSHLDEAVATRPRASRLSWNVPLRLLENYFPFNRAGIKRRHKNTALPSSCQLQMRLTAPITSCHWFWDKESDRTITFLQRLETRLAQSLGACRRTSVPATMKVTMLRRTTQTDKCHWSQVRDLPRRRRSRKPVRRCTQPTMCILGEWKYQWGWYVSWM